MDQAERNLGIAGGFIGSVLLSQPENRTAMLRSAQIAHDRMILARFNGRPEAELPLARQAAEWLRTHLAQSRPDGSGRAKPWHRRGIHPFRASIATGESNGDAAECTDRSRPDDSGEVQRTS